MAELKPCPFCGGNAEIYTGRNFPARGKNVCESEAEAQEKLEEYKRLGTIAYCHLGPREMNRANMKGPKKKWAVVVEMVAFIPRCCDRNCLGRLQTMFLTEEEATEAWNRRADYGKTKETQD